MLCEKKKKKNLIKKINEISSFLHLHLSDAFIQSDLQCIQAIHVLSLCVFPGNRTHNLLRC